MLVVALRTKVVVVLHGGRRRLEAHSGFGASTAHLVIRAHNGGVQARANDVNAVCHSSDIHWKVDRGKEQGCCEEGAESVSSALKAQQVSSPKKMKQQQMDEFAAAQLMRTD